jgi:hypothetical protein
VIFSDATWWLVALSALALWLPQNLAHELAHGAVARFYGAKDIEIWPFPGTKLGYFTFAHVQWTWTEMPTRTGLGLVSAAPQMANTLVLLLVTLLWQLVTMPTWVLSVLAGWAVVNFVDGAVNLSTFYRLQPKVTTDGWKWADRFGISAWSARVIAASWQLGFGAILLYPGF